MATPDPTSPGAAPVPSHRRHAAPPEDGTATHTRVDVVRAAVVVVAALAQVAGSPLGGALPGARSVADVSDTYATVITPAGYAFAVWGLIFAGCLAWAVYQALPSQLGRDAHRRAGWPLAVAFAANTGFELVFPQDGDWLLVALAMTVVVVAATALALGRLQEPELHGLDRVLPGAVAALLLGWVTIATVVDVAVTGVYLGSPATGGLARAAGIVALLAAAAIVLDVTLRLQASAGPFALAAGWGVLAVARHDPPLSVGLAAWAALAVVVVGLLVQVWRTRRPVRVLLG